MTLRHQIRFRRFQTKNRLQFELTPPPQLPTLAPATPAVEKPVSDIEDDELQDKVLLSAVDVFWKNCSHLTLESPVLRLGNPFSATCRLNSEDCVFDHKINAINIVWRMNEEEVSGSQYRALSERVSTLIIPHFNLVRGNLTCYIWHNESLQLLQRAEVRAGFPPERPRLSYCISSWTSFLSQSIVCNWDSGPETYLETNFTLHISETVGNCTVRYLDPKNCTTSGTKNSCLVLVSNLASYHDIWVTATNELGTETSSHICLDGMLIVKFKAPQIITVKQDTPRNDCLLGQWEMPFEMVNHSEAAFEIQYKAHDEDKWTQVPLAVINSTFFRLCNLLPYTEYQLKIRCKQKTETSPWSEWSNENTGITSECDNIEPMRLYNILLYPLFDGLPGIPASTQAYSKEGAPQCGPTIRLTQIWKTKVQLEWDELPIDDRNGFIRNYTLLYKNKNGKLHSVVVNGSEHSYVLAGLSANTEYNVNIVVSTDGGSTTGSNLAIATKTLDDGEIEVFVSVIFLFSLLMALISIAGCIYQRRRIKKHFWPSIPDPTNSTLANWIPKQLWEDVKEFQEEPSSKTPIQVVPCGGLVKANISGTNYYWIQERKNGHCPKTRTSSLNEANSSSTQSLQDFTSWQNESDPQESFQNIYIALEYNKLTVNEYRKQRNPTFAVVPADSSQSLLVCLSQIIPSEEKNMLPIFHTIPDNHLGKTVHKSNSTTSERELLQGFPLLMNLNIH
ncbi:hypothetical protein scyTo_0000038 [Scyliorhinus torazame]|uniref:Fibronectin type-III domain-containing protein n=1 Tax=Scyliorhinus torazame TaxID=75743 RepID=A0A401NNJ9_SCYTO|nr:hypothetical protein [Scyliorhinus torazame]